jgi:hypothetical protein
MRWLAAALALLVLSSAPSDLAVPAHPGGSSYRPLLTHYFCHVPTSEEAFTLVDPSGAVIPFVVTDKPIAPSEEAVQEMQSAISEFAGLVSKYRSWERDDSPTQFWSFTGFSLVMGGLTTLCVFGARREEDETEAFYAGVGAVGFGLLTVFGVGLSIGNFVGYRRKTSELRELEARLEAINPHRD